MEKGILIWVECSDGVEREMTDAEYNAWRIAELMEAIDPPLGKNIHCDTSW